MIKIMSKPWSSILLSFLSWWHPSKPHSQAFTQDCTVMLVWQLYWRILYSYVGIDLHQHHKNQHSLPLETCGWMWYRLFYFFRYHRLNSTSWASRTLNICVYRWICLWILLNICFLTLLRQIILIQSECCVTCHRAS